MYLPSYLICRGLGSSFSIVRVSASKFKESRRCRSSTENCHFKVKYWYFQKPNKHPSESKFILIVWRRSRRKKTKPIPSHFSKLSFLRIRACHHPPGSIAFDWTTCTGSVCTRCYGFVCKHDVAKVFSSSKSTTSQTANLTRYGIFENCIDVHT